MADTVIGSDRDLIAELEQTEELDSSRDAETGGHADRKAVATRNRLLAGFLVALTVISVAAGASAVTLYRENRTFDAHHARDAQIVDTARQVAVNLVTLRYGSAREDLDRILQGTTGAFRDQFTDVSGSFGQVLEQGQVESTGEVKSAGLVDATDSTATVIAAVTSTVKNTEAPGGDPRSYRMKVDLEKDGSQWLVSNVEFVP